MHLQQLLGMLQASMCNRASVPARVPRLLQTTIPWTL
jgi:hypothetical protein